MAREGRCNAMGRHEAQHVFAAARDCDARHRAVQGTIAGRLVVCNTIGALHCAQFSTPQALTLLAAKNVA